MTRKPVNGIHILECKQCKFSIWEYSRDILSPSGLPCIECGQDLDRVMSLNKADIEAMNNRMSKRLPNRSKSIFRPS